MDQSFIVIFQIIILIISVVAHEVAHGFAALHFGDKTALYKGRLTMNPLKHIDPIGTVILPIMLVLLKSPIGFGWAKPVPYNPYNFTNRTLGTRVVALAGVLTNFALALIFGLLLRFFGPTLGVGGETILYLIVLINLSLGIFNLFPIPPLDGAKILFSFLPHRFEKYHVLLEQYGFFIVFGFLVFLNFLKIDPISYLVSLCFSTITGITLSL
jgi:Zn-dependent protease